MTRQELRERIEEELRQSSEQYCLYCLYPRYDKISCCQENHFSAFTDLYPDQQQELVDEGVYEWEQNT